MSRIVLKPAFFGSLLLLTLAACRDGEREGPDATVRDSAGVRIVENRGSSAPGALGWRVEEEPLLEIGGEGSGLYQVMEAVRLGDGRIVAANAGTNELRIFGPDGTLQRSVGRPGNGPGEFQGLFWVGSTGGDSLLAWDAMLGRLSVFTPAGGLVRVVTPTKPLGFFPQAQGVLADGRIVLASGAGPGSAFASEPKVHRDTLTYVVLGRGGEVADTLGRFAGTETLTMVNPTGVLVRPLPFGRQTVSAVHGGRVYVGTGDRYELASYEPGRGLKALLRIAREPVPVGPEDVREYRRRVVTLGGEGNPTLRRQQEQLLDRAPYPATMPSYTALEADAQGNLWVEEPGKPGDEQGSLWTVLSPEGTVRGRVRMPRGLQVKQIGAGWVLGVWLGADDTEHLRLHRIRKGETGEE